MLRIALVASVVIATSACRLSLEGEDKPGDGGTDAFVSAACMEATTYQNLANIESKIFMASCTFSGCHNGAATDAGRLDLRPGMSYPDIVGVQSLIDPVYKMVAPGQPNQSYLLMVMGHIAPASMVPPAAKVLDPPGLMPQGTGGLLLCEQKRAAIERWIAAGALNN
jgi:hypothetical protein